MRLADVVGAQCLMLFGREGRQTISSMSFGGIGDAKDEDATVAYHPILTGCPYVVTETVHDDVLGTDTHTVASIVTDGFLA